MSVRPAKTQISLGIRPVWSESPLCAQWVAKNPSFLHADSEDFDQTGRMPRLTWVFTGCTVILLVLSCRGLFLDVFFTKRIDVFQHFGFLWTLEPPPPLHHPSAIKVKNFSTFTNAHETAMTGTDTIEFHILPKTPNRKCASTMDVTQHTPAQVESQEDNSSPVDDVNKANTRPKSPKTNRKRTNNAIIINRSRHSALEWPEIHSCGHKSQNINLMYSKHWTLFHNYGF